MPPITLREVELLLREVLAIVSIITTIAIVIINISIAMVIIFNACYGSNYFPIYAKHMIYMDDISEGATDQY